MPLSVARDALPIGKIIGCSTHNLDQAVKAENEGADYIAVGSIYISPTKRNATVIGIDQLCQIEEAMSIPIVAIGGINKDNIAEVMSTGVDSAAVISAALASDNVEESVRQLVNRIERKT